MPIPQNFIIRSKEPKKKGQFILSPCPSCQIGTLLVRIKHTKSEDAPIGGYGEPDTDTVDELACSNCCLKFVAAEEGQSIWEILEEGLKNFIQPDVKPLECCECHNESFQEGKTRSISDRRDWGPFGGCDPDDHKRTHYLYCSDCLTVVYITHQPKP